MTDAVTSGAIREALYTKTGATLRASGLVREVLRSTSTGAGTFLAVDGVVREVLRAPPLPIGTLTVTGIASTTTLGTPSVGPGGPPPTRTLTVTGIASTTALGTPSFTITPGFAVSGIPSTTALGSPSINASGLSTLTVTGIPSHEAVGTPIVRRAGRKWGVRAWGISAWSTWQVPLWAGVARAVVPFGPGSYAIGEPQWAVVTPCEPGDWQLVDSEDGEWAVIEPCRDWNEV